jgi:hypothetical protein
MASTGNAKVVCPVDSALCGVFARPAPVTGADAP